MFTCLQFNVFPSAPICVYSKGSYLVLREQLFYYKKNHNSLSILPETHLLQCGPET